MKVKSGHVLMAIPDRAPDISDSPATVVDVNDSTLLLNGASDGSKIPWSGVAGRMEAVDRLFRSKVSLQYILEVQQPLA